MPSAPQQIPYADLKTVRSTHENMFVTCPLCDKESTYNRVSDLNNTGLIANQLVNCLQLDCRKPFYFGGDMVGPSFILMILNCYELIEAKDYTRCITNLSQAHEIFFKQFLRVELIYKPFGFCDARQVEIRERLEESLNGQLKTLAFTKLRNIFFHMVVTPVQHDDLNTIYDFINKLKDERYDKPPRIKKLPDNTNGKLNPLLQSLHRTKICEVRNKIIHSSAYRPSMQEAVDFYQETRQNVLGLATILNIKEEIDEYRNG